LLALLSAFVLACGSSGGEEPDAAALFETFTSPGPFGVGVTTLELVDRSRPVAAHGDFPGANERPVTTEVWYPAGPSPASEELRDAPVTSGGPYPLLVFAHGLGSSRNLSTSFTRHLASHGYVVAAPDFPESTTNAPGGAWLGGLNSQPGDVSFVIDSLLDANGAEGGLLAGAVDTERIGLTGHSWGAQTTLLTIFGDQRDERIDAAVPISPAGCLLTREAVGDSATPILVIGGSQDLLFRPVNVRRAYDLANSPRYLANLIGANHSNFADIGIDDAVALSFVGAGPPPTSGQEAERYEGVIGCGADPVADVPTLAPERQRELLRAFATPFFDAYLREDDEALAFLQDGLAALLGPDVRFEYEAQ
jgi:predicted dienelactone hydrolase